jgi:uncharacterized protein (TIGR04255 family)
MDLHPTITYDNPPVNEVVYSMVFEPLESFRIRHLSELWHTFGSDLFSFDEQVRLPPEAKEAFEKAPRMLPIRVLFSNASGNDLVQIQCNRFLYNWRKRRPDDVYPGYTLCFDGFEKYLFEFQDFLAKEQIGTIFPMQYELTYFDHILENEGWESLNNLGDIFPNFEFQRDKHKLPKSVRDINWQILFDLPDNIGQLQLGIESQYRESDNRRVLTIQFTARSVEPYNPVREWFDVAHSEISKMFVNLISDEIQEKHWGRQF